MLLPLSSGWKNVPKLQFSSWKHSNFQPKWTCDTNEFLCQHLASSLFSAVLFCLRCTSPNRVTDSSLIPSPAWFGRLSQPRIVVVFPTIGCGFSSWSSQTALFQICPSFSCVSCTWIFKARSSYSRGKWN